MFVWLVLFNFFIHNSKPTPIGLQKLWTLAKQRAPNMQKAYLQVARAEELVEGSRFLWLPRFSYSLQGGPAPTYRCILPDAWMPTTLPEGMTESDFRETYCVGTDRDDSITLNLDGYVLRFEAKAVMPIFTFGKIDYARAQARAMREIAQSGVQTSRQQLWFTVRRTYFSRRAYLESARLAKKASKLLEEATEKVTEYEENGRISPVDLLRFKLGQNEFEQRMLDLERIGEISRATLEYLAGKSVEVREDEPWEYDASLPASLPELVNLALARRPEFRALLAARAQAAAAAGLAQARLLPDIGFFVRYRFADSSSDDPRSAYANDALHGNSLVFGLGIEGHLDFAMQITQMRLAALEQREVESRYAALRDAVTLEIANVRQDVVVTVRKVALTEKALRFAQAQLAALVEQENMGVLKPRDMAEALTTYFKLQFGYWELRLQLEMVRAQLALATGEPIT